MTPLRAFAALAVILIAIGALVFLANRRAPATTPQGANPTPSPAPLPGQLILFYVGEDGRLQREQRQIPDLPSGVPARIRLVVEELVAGSQHGLAAPFPWTPSVQAVFVDRAGNAYVDLSPPPSGVLAGTAGEITLTYATVNSVVANCPAIERVQLLFGGREVLTLGHLDISRPLAPRHEQVGA